MRLLTLYLAFLAITGCTDTTVSKPLGTLLDQRKMAELNGVWRTPEGKNFEIKYIDSRLALGFLDFDKAERRFNAINADCVITTVGDHKFAFLSQLGEATEYYLYHVSKLSDDVVRIRSPDSGVFSRGVLSGDLEGEMRNLSFRNKNYEHAFLEISEEAFLAFLEQKSIAVCFPEESEVEYRRSK